MSEAFSTEHIMEHLQVEARMIVDRGIVTRGQRLVPSRVDRLRALGNAVVPQVAEFVGCRIMEAIGE